MSETLDLIGWGFFVVLHFGGMYYLKGRYYIPVMSSSNP